ncbi:MAG: hypothetical protein RMA76_24440 [Deltaproteobacteria bacterium]|jgi:hypothetical protein
MPSPAKTSFVLLLVASAACSGEDSGVLDRPAVGTDFVIYGTAPAGRALAANSVRIVATTSIDVLKPEVIAGTDVDMMYAGLSADDLPANISPLDLMLVASNADGARPLPPLYDPHVMDVPSPAESPTPLAPIEGPGVSRERSEERDARLRTLISDLAIASPCREPTTPFDVTTPQLPIDALSSMATLSDGTTVIGFTSTSTIFLGFVPPNGTQLEARAVRTGTVALQTGERAVVLGLGGPEVDIDGEIWPRHLVVNYSGRGFGTVGAMLTWNAARRAYVDDTPPNPDTFPRYLYGVKTVTIEGTENLCTFGGALGSDRRAAIWCRPQGASDWTVYDFGRSFGVTSIVTSPSSPPIATDLAGSVWELESRGWRTVYEASINAGCEPLCTSFVATWAGAASDSRVAVIGGADAQLLFVDRSGGSVTTAAPSGLEEALFADERVDAEMPIIFTAITADPSGALWIATATPNLFRIAPGGASFERICLPKVLDTVAITSLQARDDGRFLIGASALYVTGDWR